MKNKAKQKRLEALKRMIERLKKNFDDMVDSEEETDLMLDWMNEIRAEIKKLEKELE